ncbi:MAG TPA: hypothetical protein VIG24_16055 [Acidimicrobiia bacterium]
MIGFNDGRRSGGLILTLVWLVGLTAAAAAVFHRTSAPRNA